VKDFKEKAEELAEMGSVNKADGSYWFDSKADMLAAAQVYATLALAEQQRIANLITIGTMSLIDPDQNIHPMEFAAWRALGLPVTGEFRPEIAKALGVS